MPKNCCIFRYLWLFRIERQILLSLILSGVFTLYWSFPAEAFERPLGCSVYKKELLAQERVLVNDLSIEGYSNLKPDDWSGSHTFAIGQIVELQEHKAWKNQDLDSSSQTIILYSEGAKSLNVGFDKFDLPDHSIFWLYSRDCEQIRGPYNNHSWHQGQLWTPIILGEEIIIEFYIAGGDDFKLPSQIVLNKGLYDIASNEHEGCYPDLSCDANSDWNEQVRSVALYTINGRESCTGQLINNTSKDFTPYFLTSDHCGVDISNDQTVVVYWNYSASRCKDSLSVNFENSQSGATLRASNDDSDFSLLELKDIPLKASNVYYAGWDATGVAPEKSVSIHHPQGGIKAMSFNNDLIYTTDYDSDSIDSSAKFWMIRDWEEGRTDIGSSGACLWDESSKLCVGLLRGGYSTCAHNSGPDWFSKFGASWNGGSSKYECLKPWLDPTNTGKMKLDGMPPK